MEREFERKKNPRDRILERTTHGDKTLERSDRTLEKES